MEMLIFYIILGFIILSIFYFFKPTKSHKSKLETYNIKEHDNNQDIVISQKKVTSEEKREIYKRIRKERKNMRLVWLANRSDLFLRINVEALSEKIDLNIELKNKEKVTRFLKSNFEPKYFYKLKCNCEVKGHFWFHPHPSAYWLFFKGRMINNNDANKITVICDFNSDISKYFEELLIKVFNSFNDYPSGGFTFIVDILEANVLSSQFYLDNVEKLIKFVAIDLYNKDYFENRTRS